MRMMTVAHNSKGSLVTIWIGGLTPLKGNNPLALYIASNLLIQKEKMPKGKGQIYIDNWVHKQKRIVFHAICECLSYHDKAIMLFEPFNVPETNVVQLWMVDEYEKGYLNCITDLSPQFLLLVTTILSI
ncbi:hypothetical protein CK203_099188 [Vitis vinifera]|uniref:Uncharacterized protein n=1 Tax=Vitis vinifera TaxID=29760 RepID=A0A438DMP0_VITVI|nr:hypothetical protein CK203_099188 [Vitis vinifera]